MSQQPPSQSQAQHPASPPAAAVASLPAHPSRPPSEMAATRALFWQNVVRDMLTGLSIELGRARAEQAKAVAAGQAPPQGVPMYDGRVAVITRLGSRIPIADVQPMLACSLAGSQSQRALSAEVQSTIFQIRTPAGEVFTLPLSEISTVHVLSPELLAQIQKANAANTGEGEGESRPFGFAALTDISETTDTPAGPPPAPAVPTIPGSLTGPPA